MNQNNNYLASKQIDLDELVQKILNFTDENGDKYTQKFSLKKIIGLIDEQEIQALDKKFALYDQLQGVDIIDFVYILTTTINSAHHETVYLIIGFIELFRTISDQLDQTQYIKFQQLTDFIAENCGEQRQEIDYLQSRKLPFKKIFLREQKQVRDIDVNAPIMQGKSNENVRSLVMSKLLTDSAPHNSQQIKQGFYAKEIQKLFTLDSLSDKIHMYNKNCHLDQIISPQKHLITDEHIIFNFCWSTRQQRIGAVLKDFQIIFWDYSDNFKYEKKIPTSNFLSNFQSNIWYIDFMDQWITIDHHPQIVFWDIVLEKMIRKFQPQNTKGTIIEILELAYLKLVAIASSDKQDRFINIFNLEANQHLIQIDMREGGIHSMVFNELHQAIITAGFENCISIYQIDAIYIDHQLSGKLKGHTAQIVAIQNIANSPMIVSADDIGIIKVWNIKTFKCIQTLNLKTKTSITKLISLDGIDKICFLGSRVNYLEWNEPLVDLQNTVLHPIQIDVFYQENKFIVSTRKDIRQINMKTGRVEIIMEGVLEDAEEQEITVFRVFGQNNNYIVGDSQGNLFQRNFKKSEEQINLQRHANYINIFKMDFNNRLFVTGGLDSKIQIQMQTKNGFVLKRSITNCFQKKGIGILEISVYHNIIVASPINHQLYIWNYENVKLKACIELNLQKQIRSVAFINGYSILLIGTSEQQIYFVKFMIEESLQKFEIIGMINLASEQQNSYNFIPLKLLIDAIYDDQGHQQECKLIVGFINGDLQIFDLTAFLKDFPFQEHVNKKHNYNPHQDIHEDFSQSVKKSKFTNTLIDDSKKIFSLNKTLQKHFTAHKEPITSLSVITQQEKFILTSSFDQYIRIFTFEGQMIASLNINHPLPILWNFKVDLQNNSKKNVLFSMKIIELIYKRHRQKILESEQSQFNLMSLVNSLIQQKQINKNEQPKVFTMQDEYQPRDLKLEQVRPFFKLELQGPQLQAMETIKRTHLIRQLNKQNENTKQDALKKKTSLIEIDNPLEFFDPKFRSKLVENKTIIPKNVQQFGQRLENSVKKKSHHPEKNTRYSAQNEETQHRQPTINNSINQETSTKIHQNLLNKSLVKIIKPFNHNIQQTEQIAQSLKFNSITNSTNDSLQQLVTYASDKNLIKFNHDSLSQRSKNKKDFNNILKGLDFKLKKAQMNTFVPDTSKQSFLHGSMSSQDLLQKKQNFSQIVDASKINFMDYLEETNIDILVDDIVQKAKKNAQSYNPKLVLFQNEFSDILDQELKIHNKNHPRKFTQKE